LADETPELENPYICDMAGGRCGDEAFCDAAGEASAQALSSAEPVIPAHAFATQAI